MNVNSSETRVRHAAVAGSFYPASSSELKNTVVKLLEQAQPGEHHPKAMIAPHAGYIYSGLTAAYAYKTLIPWKNNIRRVVLLGPSHRVAFRGIATPACDHFTTPLGDISVDALGIQGALSLPYVHENAEAHLMEHSLEVHLPFLQVVLDTFSIVPLVVGDASGEEVAELMERLWGGPETLFVISSDLSHYHPYQCAQILDSNTSHEIENCHSVLGGEQACGCRPVNGLLQVAKKHGLNVTTLDLRNSGDTAGDKERVVGYGAYALQ